jgi:hypothetical protein
MTQTTITTTPDQSQHAPAKANDDGRCLFRYARGRCKLPALGPEPGFCLRHSKSQHPEPRDVDNLCPALFGQLPDDELPNLQTPEDVSNFLARVVVLLAEGRITARRATVLTYAASLLLRSAVVIKATEKTEIIWDLDRQDVKDDPESRRVEEPSPVPTGAT